MNFLKKKIHMLRQQPEEVRLKAITRLTIISGIILVILWAGVFLPLQISLRQKETPPVESQPMIAAPVEPTVTITPTAVPIQNPSSAVELLPSNEDQVSPSPSL